MQVTLDFTGEPAQLQAAIELIERDLGGLSREATKTEKAMSQIDFDQAAKMSTQVQTHEQQTEQLKRAIEKMVAAERSSPNMAAEMSEEAAAAALEARAIDNLADQYQQLNRAKSDWVGMAGSWRDAAPFIGPRGSHHRLPGALRLLAT
jgi:hypothetical protein